MNNKKSQANMMEMIKLLTAGSTRQKMMPLDPVSLIGGGVSAISSIFGGIRARKAAEEARQRLEEERARENAWYLRRYNEDYSDTAAGRNMIRQAKDFARQNWKRAEGAQAVAGGTEAAVAQAKEAGNRMVGNTVAEMAAQDTARKENADAQHNAAESNYTQQQIAIENNRAQQITNAAQQASNAIMNSAAALGGTGTKTKQETPTATDAAMTAAASAAMADRNIDLLRGKK